jgi:hypothetical protein
MVRIKRNPFRVEILFYKGTQGCRWRSNPGLKLANAFGVRLDTLYWSSALALWMFGEYGLVCHIPFHKFLIRRIAYALPYCSCPRFARRGGGSE